MCPGVAAAQRPRTLIWLAWREPPPPRVAGMAGGWCEAWLGTGTHRLGNRGHDGPSGDAVPTSAHPFVTPPLSRAPVRHHHGFNSRAETLTLQWPETGGSPSPFPKSTRRLFRNALTPCLLSQPLCTDETSSAGVYGSRQTDGRFGLDRLTSRIPSASAVVRDYPFSIAGLFAFFSVSFFSVLLCFYFVPYFCCQGLTRRLSSLCVKGPWYVQCDCVIPSAYLKTPNNRGISLWDAHPMDWN